jgi:hypothetical protein
VRRDFKDYRIWITPAMLFLPWGTLMLLACRGNMEGFWFHCLIGYGLVLMLGCGVVTVRMWILLCRDEEDDMVDEERGLMGKIGDDVEGKYNKDDAKDIEIVRDGKKD